MTHQAKALRYMDNEHNCIQLRLLQALRDLAGRTEVDGYSKAFAGLVLLLTEGVQCEEVNEAIANLELAIQQRRTNQYLALGLKAGIFTVH